MKENLEIFDWKLSDEDHHKIEKITQGRGNPVKLYVTEEGLFRSIEELREVEMNLVWQQKKLREFCEEKNIHISAYSPLGAKGAPWGTARVMESEILKEIARSRKKSIAQVCLRWVYEQRVSVIVKSYNKERIKENLGILDWNLSVKEIQKIEQIPQGRGNPADFFVSKEGPFKSIEEFWDGEI